MKRILLSTGLFMFVAFSSAVAQIGGQAVFEKQPTYAAGKNVPTHVVAAPDMAQIHAADVQRDKNGLSYRVGVANYVNLLTTNSGLWTDLGNSRLWQLKIKSPGAEALTVIFSRLVMQGGTQLWIEGLNGDFRSETLDQSTMLEDFQNILVNNFGDEITVNLLEPKAVKGTTELRIDRVNYIYRSSGNPTVQKINESESCEVNVNCTPVGDPWQDEKRGVARILVQESDGQYLCSGTLVNNTSNDCKPYFLTALHCGVSTSAANMALWKFNFVYEATGCTSPSSVGTLLATNRRIDGCVRLADSNDGGGNSGSDFLLVQLGTLANEATTVTKLKSTNILAYWNGWDANNTPATGGAGIHHPSGDIKKISTYTGTLVSTQWGSLSGSHWRVTWTANANGHGVTEGGSSGSPLFNSAGRQVGTLTGGSSYCNTPSSPDQYGKMSMHWTGNGTPANERLKTYLDPTNTGLLIKDGSYDPCSAVTPAAPVANFVGVPTTVSVGGTVNFTDQSTNTPTSWAWAISPATGWSYAGGTSATSQNPQVTFTTQGQYTVTLTATNAVGSDAEVKTNYITVTLATGPCTATSSAEDEFIQNVTLGSINNTTGWTTYTSYPLSTTVVKGQSYTLTVVPQITGQAIGTAYQGDEIAAWIDWNGDYDFQDVGEQIAYALVTSSGFNNVFNFTAPATAMTGQVKMRVRLSFSGTPDGAPITPCGAAAYGDVEDYNINIQAVAGVNDHDPFETVSIFPNPAANQLSVDLTNVNATDVTVTLIDITGKVIATREHVSGTMATFDVSALAKGSYQVRLSDGTTTTTRSVVKL